MDCYISSQYNIHKKILLKLNQASTTWSLVPLEPRDKFLPSYGCHWFPVATAWSYWKPLGLALLPTPKVIHDSIVDYCNYANPILIQSIACKSTLFYFILKYLRIKMIWFIFLKLFLAWRSQLAAPINRGMQPSFLYTT